MKVQQYDDFQQKISDNLDSKEKLHTLFQQNKTLINEIVQKTGSGNPFLAKPYDYLYENRFYEMASFYQTELEQINKVSLFGEDG
jgi:predicted lactoylglutathione lyase